MITVNGNLVTFIFEGRPVGYMIIARHEEYDYCEYLEIYPQYRGMGYAVRGVDEYRKLNPINFRYSVTRRDSSGDKFWTKYTEDKKVQNIKGLTYEIQ